MRKLLAVALFLAALAAFAPQAGAASFEKMTLDASQSYLRLGLNDTVVVTVHLLDELGAVVNVADVPIAIDFVTGGDYVTFDNALIVMNGSGAGSAVMRLKPDNQLESWKLPQPVMVKAYVIGDPGISANAIVYITSTGTISGYVVDESQSTITGARIAVTTPDGKPFPGTFVSSDGSGSNPMGAYRIDNLPVELSGKYTLVATKNGYSGTLHADAGSGNARNDITIGGYRETVDVPGIITGNANATATPVPISGEQSETPTRPTTMTTTILIAIALITVVYIGLKTYRRMF